MTGFSVIGNFAAGYLRSISDSIDAARIAESLCVKPEREGYAEFDRHMWRIRYRSGMIWMEKKSAAFSVRESTRKAARLLRSALRLRRFHKALEKGWIGMKRKMMALLLLLVLLVMMAAGCLPRIMKGIVQGAMEKREQASASQEAVRETPREEVQLPSKTEQPAEPVQPEGTQAVYSAMDYMRLYDGYTEAVDLDGDGVIESVTIQSNEDDYTISLQVTKNGQAMPGALINGFFRDAFVAYNAEGAPCIVVSFDRGSDDCETDLYVFDGETLRFMDSQYGRVEGVYAGVWMLGGNVDALGTWTDAYRACRISCSFTFEPDGPDLFMIRNAAASRVLTANRKMQAQFFVNGALVAGTIEPGERLLPYAADESSAVYFRMEDGRTGVLKIERREYMIYIDGVHDEEAFDNVQYSG